MATDPLLRRPKPARAVGRKAPLLPEAAGIYLAHHRQVAKDSAQRLWRAPLASLMTWLVMGVALALPVGLLLVLSSVQGVSAGWDSSARITVYLADQVTLEQARRLRADVAARANIQEVVLVDRDTALQEFRTGSGLDEALAYLDENPLPHSLLVTPDESARTAAAVELLADSLGAMGEAARVQIDLDWLQRLSAITRLLERVVWVLALLLGGAVILVIGNTIRLAIENRRDEILVAKLVGGTDGFVRRPFLYTGLWYGLGGGLVALLLLGLALWWLSGPVERLADLYRSQFELSGLGLEGVLALLGCAMLLGWLGAWLAVKRHLDAIEPGVPAGSG
ncbi:permease-like cell division protein FtsX [Marinobacter sp. X15-166B]|uniref:permease-like cell division protein FtsX n=1 Tax=Marinobacter sp. X15-166B TaxID=1897620 RepID=UPI00085C9380|nr:permease-like cell division protein FtsX [Marinobacter sp. X15-166B]OEY65838.1 cell division protein [Marinobacter sp. X15-166B]